MHLKIGCDLGEVVWGATLWWRSLGRWRQRESTLHQPQNAHPTNSLAPQIQAKYEVVSENTANHLPSVKIQSWRFGII